MALAKIRVVEGTCVAVPGDDIDTDQIIPARYLKCVTFEGLGPFAFYDLRFDEKGNSKNHPFDAALTHSPSILVSGSNFGCGSSREHAPQALFYSGIRAIIAESFAEIFFGNSTGLGIPCVTLSKEHIQELYSVLQVNPAAPCKIDLVEQRITCHSLSWPLRLWPGAQQALTEGRWDPLGDLLDGMQDARAKAQELGYI